MRTIPTAAVLFACFVAGCADDGKSADESAGAETPSEETVQTQVDETSIDGATFTATQEDDGCTLTGPSEVPAGETYLVVAKDLTDGSFNNLYVSLLADGHTYEEFVALQPSPGEYFPKPAFIVYATADHEAAFEFSSAAALADDEAGYAYVSEPGPHAVYTAARGNQLWICGTFDAT